MREPANDHLWSSYLGHQVEVAEGLVHEGGRGILVLCQRKQLADQGLCIGGDTGGRGGDMGGGGLKNRARSSGGDMPLTEVWI